ncbi:M67 family metallopeptidase [Natrinema thermotolerans]|uniref:M67 family metallopeptidase n=1 Tax=Natrinema thermotolerans TaxID=121872 RepID=A0AAF0P8Z4_9EURY|nr:desampylase [Natrinema thermotolerans]QCC59230.1 hypothetical protein DVR14_11570 [Natrinema thermotolerans]WMT06191.1 M67 family metallopeptidase [Natrinema thermotolerans]
MIVLPAEIRAAILERARDGDPKEICGVLGGAYDPDGRSRVASQYPARNVADDPRTRYEIDPEQQLRLFDRLEDRSESIVGFYHSHPRGPARPSATDAANAAWPDRSYVIVSLEPLEIGSWRWRTGSDGADAPGDRFEREQVVVE